jgi:DNA-binding response OmpR family regulator
MEVLFYSDNEALARLLRAALDPADTVHQVTDERQLADALEIGAASAILLDAGFVAQAAELCQALRAHTALPIVALAGSTDAQERVALLRTGADDALARPVSPLELAARLRAKVRRAMPDQQLTPASVLIGPEHQISVWDRRAGFSPSELRLLMALQQHNGGYVSSAELSRALWQTEMRPARLRFHIWRLRRHLAALSDGLRIETRHGLGYRLVNRRGGTV